MKRLQVYVGSVFARILARYRKRNRSLNITTIAHPTLRLFCVDLACLTDECERWRTFWQIWNATAGC